MAVSHEDAITYNYKTTICFVSRTSLQAVDTTETRINIASRTREFRLNAPAAARWPALTAPAGRWVGPRVRSVGQTSPRRAGERSAGTTAGSDVPRSCRVDLTPGKRDYRRTYCWIACRTTLRY